MAEWSQLVKRTNWLSNPTLVHQPEPSKEREMLADTSLVVQTELPLIERVSSYTKLRRVITWIFRFGLNCQPSNKLIKDEVLLLKELQDADNFLCELVQLSTYGKEIAAMEKGRNLTQSNKLLPFHPFLDRNGSLRVGGRLTKANLKFSKRHPIFLAADHTNVKLLITWELLCLLHVGPTLVRGSLSRNYCILGGRRVIRWFGSV